MADVLIPRRLAGLVLASLIPASLGVMAPCGADAATDAATSAALREADVSTGLASTGYVLSGTSPRVLRRDGHALATAGVDGVQVASDGASVGTPDAGAVRLLDAAHAQGLRAQLLVSNYSDDLGDFDPRTGRRLLRDPAHRDAVAAALAGVVAQQGWDGVQVDLESLTAGDADGLTAFVQALRADLGPDRALSIAVSARTSAAGYTAGGYQLAALARSVDTIALMTYDQHGPTWSGAGPIGALGWQKRALAVALRQVPAAQVDLGFAGYGYTWPTHGTGRTVGDAGARRLVHRAGVRAVWHRSVGEWSAHLPDGTVLWWSDARSYRLRVALARQAGLHGLAVWRLGSMDPLPH